MKSEIRYQYYSVIIVLWINSSAITTIAGQVSIPDSEPHEPDGHSELYMTLNRAILMIEISIVCNIK
jgi:hypothetical protein